MIAESDETIYGGTTSRHAAWTYRHPYPWIRKIRNHVAFWDGVEIEG